MTFPVDNPYKITTYFNRLTHPGIDIAPIPAGRQGVAFRAPERVKVYSTGNNPKPRVEGEYIVLQGLETGRYYYGGHFAKRFIVQGATYVEGEVLATLGMTGNADGVHVHFEVRTTPTGGQIDPLSINWTKEEDMLNKELLASLFANYMDRYPTKAEFDMYVDKVTTNALIVDLDKSAEHKTVEQQSINGKKCLAGNKATVLKPGTYQVN